MIELTNIHKYFGDLHILKGVSMSVSRGEVVCMIGPSGSGKSTLLRCINNLVVPDEGKININGQAAYYDKIGNRHRHHSEVKIAGVREKLGMVFQQFNLFPHLNVLQNITVAPIQVKKVPQREANELARELLKKVGLLEKSHQFPGELSGGQQQRVAIARALAMKPEVMLFDEPTSALDPELVGEVLEVMLQLANDGMTMVIVTHELNFARKVADRIVFIDDGQIVEDNEPDVILVNPQHPRTQDFLRAVVHK